MTRDQQYYLSNRKEIRRKQTIYRLLHREEILKQRRDERKKHPEKHKAKDKQRAPQHKAWRKKHESTPQFKARRTTWRKKYMSSPEVKERIKAQRHTVEQRARQASYMARRRAKKFNSPGSWSGAQFLALCTKHGNVCLCCHKKRRLTPDHVVPFCKGGTNYISNIQPLCWPCNGKKHNRETDYRKSKAPAKN